MDNSGLYISIARLLGTLVKRSFVDGYHIFLERQEDNTFSLPESLPVVGDWLVQSNEAHQVSRVNGDSFSVEGESNFVNGMARLVKTEFSESELTEVITEAMSFIDNHTGQWFNKREFTDESPLTIEGNNSDLMQLRVPIIEIKKIFINDHGHPLPRSYFKAFNSRLLPDDRRNPRIKLISDQGFSLGGGLFLRGQFSRIIGSLGFLEPDGSTPSEIRTITEEFVLMKLRVDTLGLASEGSRGSVKREETDMHEIEYYKPSDSLLSSSSKISIPVVTGNLTIDRVLISYKAATTFGGSFNDNFREAPRQFFRG